MPSSVTEPVLQLRMFEDKCIDTCNKKQLEENFNSIKAKLQELEVDQSILLREQIDLKNKIDVKSKLAYELFDTKESVKEFVSILYNLNTDILANYYWNENVFTKLFKEVILENDVEKSFKDKRISQAFGLVYRDSAEKEKSRLLMECKDEMTKYFIGLILSTLTFVLIYTVLRTDIEIQIDDSSIFWMYFLLALLFITPIYFKTIDYFEIKKESSNKYYKSHDKLIVYNGDEVFKIIENTRKKSRRFNVLYQALNTIHILPNEIKKSIK